MRRAKWLAMVVVTALAAQALGAADESLDMAALVPADAKVLVETVDAAGLRTMLLDSAFWAALEKTEAFRKYEASERHREMEARLEALLADLQMTREEALRTYLGGRSAVVLLPGDEKPRGVLLTEATNAMAQRLVDATGAVEVGRHNGVAVWEARRENRADRMALVSGVLVISGAEGDALERVLDAAAGATASLGNEGHFAKAAGDLPPGWRVRAYAAETKERGLPGAAALYPRDGGHLHAEWRIVNNSSDLGPNTPVLLESPSVLPAATVAAVATALHPKAIWQEVQARAAPDSDGEQRLRRAEMGIRGWFPGQTMDSITAGLGPEAAVALVKGPPHGAPGLLALVRLTESGRPVAQAFKDGLAAKAMVLAAFAEQREGAPKIEVREETYGPTAILAVRAPVLLEKWLGEAAQDVALTVAVTDRWLVAGTTTACVKEALDAMAGSGANLATVMREAGDAAPQTPVTRWGVARPAEGSDILLDWAERLAGRARLDQAEKTVDLAEVLRLVDRLTWERADEPALIRGRADLEAAE